jgi:hypothetical protein
MKRSQFLRSSLAGLSGIWLSSGFTAFSQPAAGIKTLPSNWAWADGWIGTPDKEWQALFAKLVTAGIGGLLLNAGSDVYAKVGPLAQREGMQIHTWRWTMNRGDYMEAHPEWYTVNRLGQSVVDKPPYVGYYRWLCPSRPEVKELLIRDYSALSEIPGISGVHLDYVRYCDIYLPDGLQPGYNLVQDHEMPEFDYCYCPLCRSIFREKHGYDPMSLEDPSKDPVWHQFRLDQLVNVVRGIAEAIHRKGSVITAAVFPTPEMSRRMVRQDWSRFNLDAYLPMLYHQYYLKPTGWIADCVRETLSEMGPEAAVFPGIMINPAEFTPAVLAETIRQVRDAGGKGLSAFTAGGLTPELLEAIRRS